MPNAYPSTVTVNVGALSIEDVVAVARYGVKVEIAPEALEEVPAQVGLHLRAGLFAGAQPVGARRGEREEVVRGCRLEPLGAQFPLEAPRG